MRRLLALLLVAVVVGGVALAADDDDGVARSRAVHRSVALRRVLLGRSLQGRPIRALVIGNPAATVNALVVGNVHGDEPGGFAVVRLLHRWRPPAGVALWLVRSFNPDGTAAHTRQH